MTHDEALQIIRDVARKLGEHFDTVQILASTTEGGVTSFSSAGIGNWYARQGMAHEFINSNNAYESATQIVRAMREDQ